MKRCHFATIRSLVLSMFAALTLAITVSATLLDTEDVLYMRDGRELHGQIITETATSVVFKIVNLDAGLSTTMTFSKLEILEIERDIEVVVATKTRDADDGEDSDDEDAEEEFDPALPTMYIVPLRGVMGTDIYHATYEPIIADIKEKKPDVVVYKLNSSQPKREVAQGDIVIWVRERPFLVIEDYVELVNQFKHELPGVRQVMWIEDSQGISTLIALAWSEIYMKRQAHLEGMDLLFQVAKNDADDEDKQAKMIAAWTGLGKGFIEEGGHDLALGNAMLNPEHFLSASFRGRDVIWSLDNAGEYVVDQSYALSPDFTAEYARNFRISQETADNEADLAFLLGMREYNLMQKHAKKVVDDYITDWRKALTMSRGQWREYEDNLSFATGNQALSYLSKAERNLQRIIAAIDRWNAVKMELERQGITATRMRLMIEAIQAQKKEIRAANAGNRNRGGRRPGGPPIGPGGGG